MLDCGCLAESNRVCIDLVAESRDAENAVQGWAVSINQNSMTCADIVNPVQQKNTKKSRGGGGVNRYSMYGSIHGNIHTYIYI